jgi:hypothetical protein
MKSVITIFPVMRLMVTHPPEAVLAVIDAWWEDERECFCG